MSAPTAEAAAATLSLPYTGDYDLALSVRIAGRTVFVDPVQSPVAHLDLAFALEGRWSPVAVRIEQSAEGGSLRATVCANPDGATHRDISDQLRRILALEPDGRRLAGDAVVASLVDRFRGLRPISYPSPYEAAARAIIGHRLAMPAAAAAARRVAEAHGTALDIESRQVHAFPEPAKLAELSAVRGLSDRKVEQLRTLGRRAADGSLSSRHLLAMEYDEAMAALQRLPGIGPFSAELVMVRGCADPDVLPRTEGRLQRAIAELYGLGDNAEIAALEDVAAAWRPFRSWIGLMARQATDGRSTGSASTRAQRGAA